MGDRRGRKRSLARVRAESVPLHSPLGRRPPAQPAGDLAAGRPRRDRRPAGVGRRRPHHRDGARRPSHGGAAV
jgi:hypothetical protein